MFSMELTEV